MNLHAKFEELKNEGWKHTRTYFGEIGGWAILRKEKTEEEKMKVIIVDEASGEIHNSSKKVI